MSKLNSDEISALDQIEGQKNLQIFLFRRIEKLKWFDDLQNRGYFDSQNNPEPEPIKDKGFSIPFWSVLAYLDKAADKLTDPENVDYIDKFLSILIKVTHPSKGKPASNYQTWWHFSKILGKIPLEHIQIKHIDLVDTWLKDRFEDGLVAGELAEGLLPKLLQADTKHSKKLALRLIEILTQIKWVDDSLGSSRKSAKFLFKEWDAEKIIKQAREIGKRLSKEGVDIFKNRLIEILDETKTGDYSAIWRRAIGDHEQNKYSGQEAGSLLVTGFREALFGFFENILENIKGGRKYVEELFSDKRILFKRIAIFLVNEKYDYLKNLADQIIHEQFFKVNYRHELFHLLKVHFGDFNGTQKKRTMDIIKSIKAEDDVEAEHKAGRKAYAQLIWLTAIKDYDYEMAAELYKENIGIIGKEPEHPDFASYSGVSWVGDISPYSVEEILAMGIDSLIQALNTFEEKPGWKVPTEGALSRKLREALKLQPEYFKGQLHKFLSVDFDYCCELISGYEDLWKDRKYDNWKELLVFCNKLITDSGFWNEEIKDEKGPLAPNRSWVTGKIADLIVSGTAQDETSFSEEHLPVAWEIINQILQNEKGEKFDFKDDAVSKAINNSRGKAIEALINYSLRKARLEDNQKEGDHKEVWSGIKNVFDMEIEKARNANYEFSTLCGMYILNILYLNKDWVLGNFDKIFPDEFPSNWVCAIHGYTYAQGFNPIIYERMAQGDHLKRAVESDYLEDQAKNRIIENIVLSFIRGDENLDDEESLITYLLERNQPDEVNHIIWFFAPHQGDYDEKVAKAALGLWKWLSSKYKGKEADHEKILSNLNVLSGYIQKLDSVTKGLLLQSSPYVDVSYNSHYFMEELKRLVDSYPLDIGEIYLAMLDKSRPVYEKEEIQYIVEKLFKTGDAEGRLADKICDKYIDTGLLIEIREKYRGTT